ncbi:hypothetical protein HCA55_09325 [Listeria booriae]|uniref:Wall-associated protein n=1 Tax=Listeria booriae TaxID=1552123 RepID=A0A842AYJ1_9LIST|nr:RHS repeat-associated core domain-containing protein [Listeria booriae]MBC1796930.1 hypothetical protein [Listeria booriae]
MDRKLVQDTWVWRGMRCRARRKKDVEFDVGNKTTWTMQNKGLWSTNAEIAAGGWGLHTDGKGAELAQDPSPVYTNSGGTLGYLKTYAFRVKAYTKTGKQETSAISGIYKPTIPLVGSQQGMVDYWTSIPMIGGEVNATNGNFLFSETDFELEGRGPSINISRTFNSQNDQVGLFGKGWTSTLETRVAEQANGDVLLYESDNKTQLFMKTGTTYEAPAGVYSTLTKTATGFLLVEQDKSEVAFNAAGQMLTEKDPNGNVLTYTYNLAGNPEKVVVDADGLKLSTTTSYEANNLIKEVSPKGQEETYTYDADGNVTSVTDPYGMENYTYNENNDVTSMTDTENKTTTVAYDDADAVSETNQSGGATSTVSQYDKYGNVIKGTAELSTANNILANPSFEKDLVATEWFSQVYQTATGTVAIDKTTSAPGGLSGAASLKITGKSTGRGFTAGKQIVELEPDATYTLSALIKTSDMKDTNVFFNVELHDATGKRVTDGEAWQNNRYSDIKSNRPWTKRQLTIKTTKTTAKAYIFLEVEQNKDTGGAGTAWFDNLQLEKGEASANFNPVLNSSFENSTELMATGWWRGSTAGADKMAIDDTEGFADSSSARIVRTAVTDVDSKYGQEIMLNQTTAKNVTVTAMSKSENVVNKAGGEKLSNDYAILAEAVLNDGVTKSFYAPFPTGTNEWNRSAVTVKVDKPITRLKIWTLFRGQHTGKAWFDNMRVIDDEVLTENTYDSNGNYVVASYDEENRKTAFTYDVYGNKLTETDEKGNTKKLEYNADNQLTKTTLANGTAVAYKYDDNGNTTEKFVTADGKEQQNSYAYDSDNKVTQFTDALGRKISYEYDANANQTKVTKPNGDTIESIYDSADRATGVKWNGQTAFNFQFDPNGNETKVTDVATGVVRDKAYDDADRITKQTERGGSVSWTYKDKPSKDNKGKTDKINEVIVSHGAHNYKATYDYNALDQNTKFSDGSRNYYLDYDEFGNVSHYINGNGVGTNFNYDATQKVREIQIGSKLGDNIFEESYTYDAASNRTAIDNKKAGKTSYEYDAINQLTKETLPDGTVKAYMYDGFGNRIKVTDSSKTKAIDASYNDGNQLTTWNGDKLTYDTNGNRLSDGKYTYTWDTADQLTAITKKDETTPFATYKYGDDNRRIEKTVNGQTTKYYYDGDSIDVLYETDGAGTVQRQYIYSDSNVRMAMKVGTKTVFYHYNAHGDVVALTNEAGDIVAEYSYDAWGNVLQVAETTNEAKQNPFGYAGYTYDKEIGMYYLMARYYEPKQGIFISVDPDPGDEDDPLTMNSYNYANNNPVMHIDPDGHWVWLAINAGFAAYDGYKAYKKTKSWKRAAFAAGKGALGGGKLKAAGKALRTMKVIGKRKYRQKFKHDMITPRARRFIRYYEGKGHRPNGYAQGKYKNQERRLPTGKTYKEYDVYRKMGRTNTQRGNRGKKRLVRSNDGKWYYTNTHYKTFRQVRRW